MNPGVLLREWGMFVPAARGGTFAVADKNRSCSCALVVAWVMPKIVLMFRIAGTVPIGGPSEGLAPDRVDEGMTLRIRTPHHAQF